MGQENIEANEPSARSSAAADYATALWDETEELLAEAERDIAAERLSGNVVNAAFARGERTAITNVRHWIESHNDIAHPRAGENNQTKKGE